MGPQIGDRYLSAPDRIAWQYSDDGRAEFSGAWELVENGGYRKNGDPKFPKMTLIIQQESSKLTFREKRIKQGKEEVRTFLYNVDGSGETNAGKIEVWRTQEPQLQSVTRTEKNRIVTAYKHDWNLATTRHTPAGVVPTEIESSSQLEAEWRLDASGNELTLRTNALSLNNNAEPRASFAPVKLKFRRN
jgi:hypothetical protein